jgi:hypothetical protein
LHHSAVVPPTVSDSQLAKQDLHNTSTHRVTSIVLKPLPANADSSIRGNFEFDSNVTDLSDQQLEAGFA